MPSRNCKTKECPKIQFHNSNLRELSENDINTLKAQGFQKQYGKEIVNIWKQHSEKTEGICTFNEAARGILHLRELHKRNLRT